MQREKEYPISAHCASQWLLVAESHLYFVWNSILFASFAVTNPVIANRQTNNTTISFILTKDSSFLFGFWFFFDFSCWIFFSIFLLFILVQNQYILFEICHSIIRDLNKVINYTSIYRLLLTVITRMVLFLNDRGTLNYILFLNHEKKHYSLLIYFLKTLL